MFAVVDAYIFVFFFLINIRCNAIISYYKTLHIIKNWKRFQTNTSNNNLVPIWVLEVPTINILNGYIDQLPKITAPLNSTIMFYIGTLYLLSKYLRQTLLISYVGLQ